MLTYGMLAFLGFLGCSLGIWLITALISLALFKAKKKIPARVLFVISLIFLTLFIMSLSTFYFIPWYASALINTALWIIFILAIMRLWFPKKKLKSPVFIGSMVGLLLFSLVMVWFWSFFFSGICIGFHPDEVTYTGSRLGSPDKCPNYAPAPCHVYLTLGKDISKNINVIFHSTTHYVHPIVYFGFQNTTQVTSANFMNLTAVVYPLDFISQFSKRWVYYAYLDNLVPDQTYYFLVGDAGVPATYSTLRKFRTGITGGSYKFASGGDVGVEWPYPILTTQQVAAKDPLFLVLGGDIAYANGLPGCYQRWDDLMWMFQNTLVAPDGRSIPLIVSIGNHEAGVGWGSYNKADAPFFYWYLPHEMIPGLAPTDLPSYRYHLIGNNTVLYVLDSEIVLSAESQASWLNSSMLSHASLPNTFAVYHIPTHPASRDVATAPIPVIINQWVPLFDQHHLKVSFENHDHVFVRSHCTIGNQVNDSGTLYVGAGAYGVLGTIAADILTREYVVIAKAIRHFHFVEVEGSNVTITTIAYDGTVLDVVSKAN